MPDGTDYTWKETPDTSTAGDKPATIIVTYPDGSKEEVPITVHVKDDTPTTPSDADKYDPKGQDITVDKGETPKAEDGISNKGDLPDGTDYTWKETPDTSTAGDKPATIIVTYPDGTKEEVPITVHVKDDTPTTPSDADKYDPKGQDITVDKGETPKAEDGISNKGDLPDGTDYTWKETPDTSTAGDKDATVIVTYPDGSKEEVPITVHVKDDTPTTPSDADKYDPKGQDITVDKGETPKAEDGISNKGDLPDGTDYTWKETPDTSTPGDKDATVIVTYPDGSKDEVPVTIHVKDDTPTTPSDADKYDPKGQDITVDKGETPKAEDGISNKGDLPDGTDYTWKETPDTSTPGDKDATVIVTYPDGSKDEVPVTIHVKDNTPTKTTDADKYDPKGQDVTVDKGETPKAEDGISNKGDLPDGTDYTWKETPDTSAPGDKDATVIVTYPDGSKDEVPVTIHVKDNTPTKTTDADKYDPKGQDVTVDKGETPKAEDGISNKGDLPDGTDYTWKETPDTSTPGDKDATIIVTYPDGSKDEVPVTIHVKDDTKNNGGETTKNPEPKGQDVDTKPGKLPNPGDAISNKGDMPDGTDYTWVKKPDVSKPGKSTGVVEVTYPDGTKRRVTVTVNVLAEPENNNSGKGKGNGNGSGNMGAGYSNSNGSGNATAGVNADRDTLPQTGEGDKSAMSVAGILMAGAAFILGLAGDRKRKRR
ncbi:hypothetical protein LCB40_01650 [Lactobacillus corticis]|uniref:Gram-positive cocci surface proteins LPxTG domain-containing protein n=1 Tax=Lactobacillus corticis TaxID=2201249 RepID=A0A916QFE0_9LACO|nr:Rib/alpha-like domain-containing protein [Lactobacillus corticis]GFZ26285.1 hypothetical protein LCB40_01650 [Lactobacillus corticis]